MLRDPQLYAQQVSEMAHRLFTVLHVPSPAQVWQAGGTASHDGYQAIVSISQFIVLICRPFVLALGWFVVTLARLIWEHVIVNGLDNHGLSQTKEALFTLWKFQKGLTPKQLLLEAVVCAALVAIYLLRQWLQRNRYIQRAQVWINRKSRQTQEVSSDFCVSCWIHGRSCSPSIRRGRRNRHGALELIGVGGISSSRAGGILKPELEFPPSLVNSESIAKKRPKTTIKSSSSVNTASDNKNCQSNSGLCCQYRRHLGDSLLNSFYLSVDIDLSFGPRTNCQRILGVGGDDSARCLCSVHRHAVHSTPHRCRNGGDSGSPLLDILVVPSLLYRHSLARSG
jgi:hypothetical protein